VGLIGTDVGVFKELSGAKVGRKSKTEERNGENFAFGTEI
jgi:hypothetical protein